jgi:hypothetical protein
MAEKVNHGPILKHTNMKVTPGFITCNVNDSFKEPLSFFLVFEKFKIIFVTIATRRVDQAWTGCIGQGWQLVGVQV